MRPSPPPAIASDRPTDLAESDLAKPDLAECGWRITEVYQPDGTIAYVNIPLAENRELAEENQVLARAKAEAEQRAAEMAALLARYQQQFGDLPGG